MPESHGPGPGGVSLPGPGPHGPEPATRVRLRRHEVLRGASVQQHAAPAAWNRLQVTPAQVSTLEIWRQRPGHQPASIYRLEFESGGPASVFAKRCDAASAQVERTCYEELVPRLLLSSPTYFGSIEEPDGTCWLFLEDVGRDKFSAHDPVHRALASRWLGRLHRYGEGLEAARTLPEAGPPRYLQHLRDGRARITLNSGNPGLTDAEREFLSETVALLDQIESRWDAIERACVGVPETLVHGDFCTKNVRIRHEPAGPVLYALDWELAGWGIPVADLAPARGEDTTLQVDPGLYVHALGRSQSALKPAAIERLSLIGYVLRRLAGIDWESLSLGFENPVCLLDPIASIRVHHRSLMRALTRAGAWLR